MILVTGANGFIGKAVIVEALSRNFTIRAATRLPMEFPSAVQNSVLGNISGSTDWSDSLRNCEVIVHSAAKAHFSANSSGSIFSELFRINVEGTLSLAQQAARAGVKRFVFLSTIGVNGAETFGAPFCAQDMVAPHSLYAKSKYEAELGLKALAAQTGMEVVIIRPPLVYGPNAPGNFGSLIRWIKRGLPLPLGVIQNQRSFVALDNLVDLILLCITCPSAANQTFLVSDGEDVSTTELLRRIAHAMGRPARLLPIPVIVLKVAAGLVGKADLVRGLCSSLQVDISKTRETLNWEPLIDLDEGLHRAVRERI